MKRILIIALVVIVVLIISKLFNSKPKKKSKNIMEVIEENPLFKMMNEMSASEEETAIADYGEFGYEASNPIPVKSELDISTYLGRLRTIAGKKVAYKKLGITNTPLIETPIAIYKITLHGTLLATLYISANQFINSERAPKNFELAALPH
ncbi:hypothetical protein [Cellulophaga algicola]|nr:hypothetical protein [Cellulophaga algicola]